MNFPGFQSNLCCASTGTKMLVYLRLYVGNSSHILFHKVSNSFLNSASRMKNEPPLYWLCQGSAHICNYPIIFGRRHGHVDRYYALSAVSALLKYVEIRLNTQFASGSLRIRFVPVEGTMMIDPETARNLEIVDNMGNARSPHSLFGYNFSTSHRGVLTFYQRCESLLYRHGEATITCDVAGTRYRHALSLVYSNYCF
jgi:hypothetical protein